MLDGLLGRGFSAKCKSLLKLTKTRIDAIKRKRNAMQKYLRKDIADLLSNGLDINAYGRAEGLLVELNRSSCYDSLEQFSEAIYKKLSLMQKQRECPEECREAVSSLMFAAARFADLPELRDLRDTFTEKYGKTLEAFVSKELLEYVSSEPPTMEKKLQLMRGIALEFSIQWDSTAFERKIVNPSLSTQDQSKRQGSLNDAKIDYNKLLSKRDELATKRENLDELSTARRTHSNDGYMQGNKEETTLDRDNVRVPSIGRHVPSHGRRGSSEDYRLHGEGGQTVSEMDNQVSRRKWEHADDRYKQQKVGNEIIMERENGGVLPGQKHCDDGVKPDKVGYGERGNRRSVHEKVETVRGRDKQNKPSDKGQEYLPIEHKLKTSNKEEVHITADSQMSSQTPPSLVEMANTGTDKIKLLPPPPYIKPSVGKHTNRYMSPDNNNEAPADFAVKPDAIKMGVEQVHEMVAGRRVNAHDYLDDQDDLGGDKKPKPKSVRRRRVKPPPGQDHRENCEGDEAVKKHSSGRRREDRRQGLQHALDDRNSNDHEDRMMDKLLVHYSKKPSAFDPTKIREERRGENASAGHHDVSDATKPHRHRRKGVADLEAEPVPAPSRAISLPPEPTAPPETERAPTRATSFQPDMFNPGGHVHPRLPDYDDLAARFAALRGR